MERASQMQETIIETSNEVLLPFFVFYCFCFVFALFCTVMCIMLHCFLFLVFSSDYNSFVFDVYENREGETKRKGQKRVMFVKRSSG